MQNRVTTDNSELLALRREYLADVRSKLDAVKRHADDLSSSEKFGVSFPYLLFVSHQLKGSGGTFGFPEISKVASEMSRELNRFMRPEEAQKPTTQELSARLHALAVTLDRIAEEADKRV